MTKAAQHLLAVGAGAYLLFLVTSFPAAQAYRLVHDSIPPLALSGVRGTIWTGQARNTQFGGQSLGALTWRLHPWAIAMGRFQVALRFDNAGGRGETLVWRGLDGHGLGDLRAEVSLAQWPSLWQNLPMRLDGELTLALDAIRVADDEIRAVDGTIAWRHAAVLWQGAVHLGELRLELQTGDGRIEGTLHDDGGPLEVRGRIELQPDGNFRLSGTANPRPGAQNELVQAVRLLGKPAAGGATTIEWAGKFAMTKSGPGFSIRYE